MSFWNKGPPTRRGVRPSPRRLGRSLLLLLLPALTIAAAEHHRAIRGSFFSGPNQDPSYSYLLGSLQLARHGTTAFYHHPGLPGQGLGAAVLTACYLAAGEHDDLTRDVLTRPELYLRAIQLSILAAVVSGLVAAGFLVRRRGDTVAALLLQASPFLGAASLVNLSQVGPESILVLATTLLSLAVWHVAAAAPADERAIAIGFGALAAFALTTRISALPYALIPPLLLATWRGRAVFAGTIAIGSGLFMLLIAGYWQAFFDWSLFVGQRTGSWGSAQRSLLDLGLYAEGLTSLFQRHHAFFAVMALAAATWLWHWPRQREAERHRLFHRALGVVLIAQVVQVLLVSKSPADRYFVPATALAGLDLALVWVLMTGGDSRRVRHWCRAVAAVVLLLLPITLELPRHHSELKRLRKGVEDQHLIAAEIAGMPEDCKVAEFFRASSMPFALHFGHRVRPTAFAKELTELYPDELFYNFRGRHFENFAGRIPTAEIAQKHSCLALHGHFRSDLAPLVVRRSPLETLYSVPSLDAVIDPK